MPANRNLLIGGCTESSAVRVRQSVRQAAIAVALVNCSDEVQLDAIDQVIEVDQTHGGLVLGGNVIIVQ